MRIVLSTLNARYVHAATAPFCLLAGLRAYASRPYAATVVEGTVNEPIEAIAARIAGERPSLVSLSVYIWNRRESAALVHALRTALPDAYLVAGGPEAEHDAENFLAECPLDAVLCGEGERQIALLADALSAGCDPTAIPGSVVRSDGGVRITPPLPPVECPVSAVIPEYLAAARGRIAYLETSRGCPFRCAFCLSGAIGDGVRFYPVARAKHEMLSLANAGVRTVKLVDRTFNADRARARELWRFVIDEYGRGIPRGVSFHFEVAGDLLEEEDIALLASAPHGAIRLEIGIQSFSKDTLAAVCRRTDSDRVAEVVARLASGKNLELHIDLIAGLPGEGIAEFAEGFDRAYRLEPSMLQVGFLKLLHGAPMRRDTEKYPCTYRSDPPYEVTSTPVMSAAELDVLHALEGAVDHLYNSHRFRRTLRYLICELGHRPFFVFSEFGKGVPAHGISLNAYTDAFFDFCVALPGVVAERLFDLLLTDRMTAVHDHALPGRLYRPDARTAPLRRRLRAERAAAGNAVPFDAAILADGASFLIVEYGERDPVTGEFPHKVLPL